MLAHLVSIGNSKGIRIPATLMRQYNIQEDVELVTGKDEIIIRPLAKSPRKGWENSFSMMHERGEDDLLIDDSLDMEELEWS